MRTMPYLSSIETKIHLLEKVTGKKVRLVEQEEKTFIVTRDEVFPVTLRYSYEVVASSQEEAKRKIESGEFLSRDFVEQLSHPEEEKPSEINIFEIKEINGKDSESELETN